jgi:hypothetical protein
MPPELKEWLSEEATRNRRSLNGEIIKRLEESRAQQNRARKPKEEKAKP